MKLLVDNSVSSNTLWVVLAHIILRQTVLQIRIFWLGSRRMVAIARLSTMCFGAPLQKAFARRGIAEFSHALDLQDHFKLCFSLLHAHRRHPGKSYLYVVGLHGFYLGQGAVIRASGHGMGIIGRLKEHFTAWRGLQLKRTGISNSRRYEVLLDNPSPVFTFTPALTMPLANATAVEAAHIAICRPPANLLPDLPTFHPSQPTPTPQHPRARPRKRLTRKMRRGAETLASSVLTRSDDHLQSVMHNLVRKQISRNHYVLRLQQLRLMLRRPLASVYFYYQRRELERSNVVGPLSIFQKGQAPLLLRFLAYRPQEVDL